MQDEFKHLNKKLDSIEVELKTMNITLAKNTEQLAYHIKRTNLLEQELRPVTKHVEQMRGAGKLVAITALVASIAAILLEVL